MPAKGATVPGLDLEAALAGLRRVDGFAGAARDALQPMAVKGLFHDHVRVAGTPWLLRLPRASQFELGPADNLDYQEACFAHAAPSGATPALRGRIEPRPGLPVGRSGGGGGGRRAGAPAGRPRRDGRLPCRDSRAPPAARRGTPAARRACRSDRRHSRLHRAPGSLFRPRRDGALRARPDRRGAHLGAGLRRAVRRRAPAAHALRHRHPSRQLPDRERGRRDPCGLRRPREGALRLARHRRGAFHPLHLDDVGRRLRRRALARPRARLLRRLARRDSPRPRGGAEAVADADAAPGPGSAP